MEYRKVKSVAKQIITRGPALSKLIRDTMSTISKAVGDTLGPGGRPVIIERFEHGMPPMTTKDGVTVFRSLGFENAAQHCIMETARDAAVRTASEAGDGTTTATILAEAIVRLTDEFCSRNKRVSPQRVVRYLENQFKTVIEPAIRDLSIKVDSTTEDGQKLLKNVARISANGDEPLAEAVMKCFELVGDEGNVTIAEVSGPSSYEVEQIDGYPIPVGYEESCAKFYSMVINDKGGQMCRMENPVFVLYHGTVTDINTAFTLLAKVGDMFDLLLQGKQDEYKHSNVVFVAIGFSEQVLATFCASFHTPNSIRIFPLTVPKSPMANGQLNFLDDIAAVTGATVFDPINKPLDTGTLDDLGPGVESFESGRFRSAILGKASKYGEPWMTKLLDRVDVVTQMLEKPESELDRILIQERLGKLTGGIAKLRVVGASNGELKEKRDRAEDAVCAVRGTLKHGCLPGGGWTMLKLMSLLENNPINNEILKPALHEPVWRLLFNCGMNIEEAQETQDPILQGLRDGTTVVYDALEGKWGDPRDLGIFDSTPAVLEAIRNSISNASVLGTSGGIVVFARDNELERTEARDVQEFIRTANHNPANERA